jgi:hypothetical protein
MRYDLPKLHAFNFVLDDVLEGGVNASLGLDGHGKALSFLLLAASVRVRACDLSLVSDEARLSGLQNNFGGTPCSLEGSSWSVLPEPR